MAEYIDKKLKALRAHLDAMDATERKRLAAKSRDSAIALPDLIRQGDVLSVAVALEDGHDVTKQDAQGMTALHHSAACDTPVITQLLIESPSPAPWVRDNEGRLPLDIARECGHSHVGDQIERVTYPELFRGEKDGPVPRDTLKKFDTMRERLNSPDTRPPHHRELRLHHEHMRDRNRDDVSRGR